MAEKNILGKYKSGLYYKICLYSGSPEWIHGSQPAGQGELLAAICVNKDTCQVDIAVDRERFTSEFRQDIEKELDKAFATLKVHEYDRQHFELLYQTPTGTTLIPTVKRRLPRNGIWNSLARLFSR